MNILKGSIKILCGGLDLDNGQRFYFLAKFLADKDPDREIIKREFNEVIANEEFDLLAFISENDELIENPTLYTRDELINYLKEWLWDYLYPENVLTENQIFELGKDVVIILKSYSENEGWMFSYDLYAMLKEQQGYIDLEYYNIWKIDYRSLNIQRRPIENKDREIGYLKYNEE